MEGGGDLFCLETISSSVPGDGSFDNKKGEPSKDFSVKVTSQGATPES